MRDKIIRFMSGRYGFDRLGQALAISAAILIMLSGLFWDKNIYSFVVCACCVVPVQSMLQEARAARK